MNLLLLPLQATHNKPDTRPCIHPFTGMVLASNNHMPKHTAYDRDLTHMR